MEKKLKPGSLMAALKEKTSWLGVNLGPKEGEKRPRKTNIGWLLAGRKEKCCFTQQATITS